MDIFQSVRRSEAEARPAVNARRAATVRKDIKEKLLEIIDVRVATKRLKAFFVDAECRAQDLPYEQRERTIESLCRACTRIGSTTVLARFKAWPALEGR